MVWVLAIAAAIWMIGAQMSASARARWALIGLLYALVLLAQFLLAEAHPVRQMLGGSFGEWLLVGVLVAVVFGYREGLARLKARAQPAVAPVADGKLQGAELERYARHIMLREIGGTGQRKLKEAKVLVIGAGEPSPPAPITSADVSGSGGGRHHWRDRRRCSRGDEFAAPDRP